MKEGIISRFDTNITLYEEDVRKADSQRILPGWNFCSFFTQKVRPFVDSKSATETHE